MKTALLTMTAALLLSGVAAGCDDGKIYPSNEDLSGDNGFTVTMSGEITNAESSYRPGLSLVLAAFKDGNEFAVVMKNVGNGGEDVQLTNVSPNVSTVELCLVNTLRKRVFTIVGQNVSATAGENVAFNIGDVDASAFSIMQTAVFSNMCIQCHGATGHAAAGLDLQTGKAYDMLVNMPSTVVEGELRVNPGNASVSTLWQALATDDSEKWSFDHSNLLDEEKSSFVGGWINGL